MKAKELRIGNWVEHNEKWCYRRDNLPENTPFQFQWDESDWTGAGESMLDLDDVSPIPLTEEWLIKFGFEKQPHNYWQKLNDFTVEYWESQNIFTHYLSDVNLEFVHQLQNLYFALTGNEIL